MASIPQMEALGWGNPGAEGSDAAARFRANHIKTLRHRGIALPTNANPDWQYVITVLVEFLERLGHDFSDVRDDWGYANRDVRGNPGSKSMHAWGLAVDLDAVSNPRGPRRTTFPVTRTRALCKALGLRWGYDFTTTPDAMHFELAPGITPAKLKAIVRDLKRGRLLSVARAVGVSTAGLVGLGLVVAPPAATPKPPVPVPSVKPTTAKPTTVRPSTPRPSTPRPTTPPPTATDTPSPTGTPTPEPTSPSAEPTGTPSPASPTSVPTSVTPARTTTVTVTARPATRTVTRTRTATRTATRTVTATRRVVRDFVIVRPGDTLSGIAKAEGVPLALVRGLNPTLDPDLLFPGVRVRVR